MPTGGASYGGSLLDLEGWAVGERVAVLAFFLGTPMMLCGLVFATILATSATSATSMPSIKYLDGEREYKVAVPFALFFYLEAAVDTARNDWGLVNPLNRWTCCSAAFRGGVRLISEVDGGVPHCTLR